MSIRTNDAALALVNFDKTTTRTLVSIRKNDAAFSQVKIQIKCAKNSVAKNEIHKNMNSFWCLTHLMIGGEYHTGSSADMAVPVLPFHMECRRLSFLPKFTEMCETIAWLKTKFMRA